MLLFSSHKRKNNYPRIDADVPTKEKDIKILSKNRHSSSQQNGSFLQVQNVYLCILFNLPCKRINNI